MCMVHLKELPADEVLPGACSCSQLLWRVACRLHSTCVSHPPDDVAPSSCWDMLRQHV